MLIKKCTRCGKLFPYHTGSLCPACVSDAGRRDNDKIYNQRYRNKQSDQFYHSSEWKRLSRVVLANAQYRCAECGGLAVEVHHIIPVRDDWSKRLDIHNLVPLCTSCHNRRRQGSAKSSQIFAPTSQVGLSAAKTRFILNFGGDRIGRNREPVSLILAKGNIAHKTKAELTARKQGEVPAIADHIVPPAFLTTQTQRDRFLTLSQELIRLDIMSNLDCDVLGRYIRSAEDWVTYGKLVKKAQSQLNKALTEDNAEKAEQYTALLLKYESLRAKAFTQCHTCASALGLTITSRCKIVVPKKDDESKENKYTGFIS